MLAVVAALDREVHDLQRSLRSCSRQPLASGHLFQGDFQGKSLLLLITGIGPSRARTATEALLADYPVDGLIMAGLAGGLSPDLRSGTLVLASSIGLWQVDQQGSEAAETAPCDENLLQTARQLLRGWRKPFITGRTACSPVLLSARQQKEELFRASGAQVVDMESFWIARATLERDVPYLNVRAVLDTSKDGLPRYLLGFAEESWQARAKAARNVGLHPWDWLKLLSLARKERAARRSLSRFLRAFIPLL